MNTSLKPNLKGYYEACGFSVRDIPGYDGAIEARQRNEAGTENITLLWAQEEVPEKTDRSRELRLIGELAKLQSRYPHAPAFFVAESLSGWTAEFRRDLASLGMRFREESLFFDAEFNSDVNPDASDVAKELRGEASQSLTFRVPQPCRVATGIAPSTQVHDDLVDLLRRALGDAQPPAKIVFLVGPAGGGKTFAFNEVFRRLYEGFQQKKRRRESASRPLPITPKHLARSRDNRFGDVMDKFLSTEIARPIGRDGLNWMIDHGRLSLLCDGLDEVLAADDSFFSFLLDRLTTPNGSGRILVCVRDSLFNTCTNLKEFLADYGNAITVAHVAPWAEATKKAYALKHFQGNGARANDFVHHIQSRPQSREISSSPFFCRMLAERFEEGAFNADTSLSALCEQSIRAVCEREYSKGLLKPGIINLPELMEMLENVAGEMLKTGFSGIPVEELRCFSELHCPDGLTEQERSNFVIRLTQLPLFSRSADGTAVDFQHEILGFFLLAKSLTSTLAKAGGDDLFGRYVDKPGLLERGVFLNLLASVIKERALSPHLWNLLEDQNLGPTTFRVILQTAIHTDPTTLPQDLLERNLQHRDLSNLHFVKLDLKGARFDGADLTNTRFSRCDLRGASLFGALLSETVFELDAHDITGLKLSANSRLHSAWLRRKRLTRPSEIVAQLTGAPEVLHAATSLPCPLALQARFLFRKFVQPSGFARKNEVDLRGFLRGHHEDGAATNKEILDVLTSHGYLDQKLRPEPVVSRPTTGSKYGEIVSFVTSLELSSGLRAAMDELCSGEKCQHVPPRTSP